MMGKVAVIAQGVYTSIQDLGRFGFSKFGVPKSGAMDQEALRWVNLILGNHENDAVLEWVMQAPILKFSAPTCVCVTGGDLAVFLNDIPVGCYVQVVVGKGDVLRVENTSKIVYGYIGVKKGFQSEKKFKSRSWYTGITDKIKLNKKDEISYLKHVDKGAKFAKIAAKVYAKPTTILNVYEGAEFSLLSIKQQKMLWGHSFSISNTRSRMAIQLIGKLQNTLPPIVTSPVLPGTVQLTPSGTLIVLMRDCQTTGGYPRVLQLSEDAINSIAQHQAGSVVQFNKVAL